MRITTDRLVIDRLTMDDFEPFKRVSGDSRVARMLGTFPSPCTDAKARQCIEGSQDVNRPGYRLAVRHDGAFAGSVGVSPMPQDGAPTISYFLDPALWGQGLIGEALDAFLPAIEARHDLAAVEASAFEDNPASQRLLERRCFRLVATLLEESAARVDLSPSRLYRRERKDAI